MPPSSSKKCVKICDGVGAFRKKDISPAQDSRNNGQEEYEGSDANPYQKADQHRSAKVDTQYLPSLQPGQDGNIDWTPLAAMTGTRPPVHNFSTSRYSIEEWRKHNNNVLDTNIINQSNIIDYNAKTAIMSAFGNVDKTQIENNKRLKKKAMDIFRWKTEVQRACKAISDEVELLELERQRLKGASRNLMLPESISKECLELRSKRIGNELVADEAFIELRKEMNLVGDVKTTLQETLAKIEKQLSINKSVKHRIEYDYCDKEQAYQTDTENLKLTPKSNTILFRPGATKFGEQSSPLEVWEYYCRENIIHCEEARQSSADLRGSLIAILIGVGRKLRAQADKTDLALLKTVSHTQEMCTKLEECLKNVLQRIADTEKLIDELKSSVRKMDAAMKLAQTRLDNRNNGRPHGECVRDQTQFGLIEEVSKIHSKVTALLVQIKNAEQVRIGLMDKRREIEKEIACKRKTLNIDRDRCGMIRSHFPSASELSGI